MDTDGAADRTVNARSIASYERAARLYREKSPPEPSPDVAGFLAELATRVPGGHVLELGSGPGSDARHLESLGLRVERTDATHAFVDLMRADGCTARHLNAVTDELGGPYEAIYAGAMLLHLPLAELSAVLAKARAASRVLALTVKQGDGEGWTSVRLDVPRWFRYWREPQLRAVLTGAGWTVETVHHVTGRVEPWLQVLAS